MRNKSKRLAALLLSFLMVISMIPTTGLTIEAAAKPKLAKKSVSIVIGGTSKIKVKNAPKEAKITYKSAKKSIATVSKQGRVKGIKSGTTKITVSVKKNSKTTKLTYKVTVKKPKLSKSKLSLASEKTAKLSVKNKPKKAKYTWQSSNPKVATVNKNGKVVAKTKGTANIKVKVKTAKKTYSLSCKVTVNSPSNEKQTYTVTFNSNGGSSVASQTVKKNTRVTKPADPIRNGYTFDGWYTAASDGIPFDFNTAITNNLTLYAHWVLDTHSASLNNFTTDEIYWITGQNNDITFTVEGLNIHSSVILCNDKNEQIAEMHDDGIDGDVTADDGIYTFILTTKPNTARTEVYYALTDNISSNDIEIFYFDKPTENSAQEMQNIQVEINSIESDFLNESGFVTENRIDDALSAVETYANTLQNEGTVVDYEISDNGIVMKLSTGLSVYYTPNIEGVDSIGSDVSMTVITYQPCLNMYNDLDQYMELPDKAASEINDTFNNYTYSNANNYGNSEVSLEQIKTFGSNQIVLWHGHGGFTNSNHSILMTGEDFDWNAWWWDITYWWDCVQNRIIESSNGRAMITAKYIDKYCSNMDNSFFYLAACQSGKDNVLANSFLNKGASAVIANTETIYTVYNLLMEYEVAHNLTQINSSTQNYHTLSEALSSAKSKYGDNDLEWYSGNNPKNEVASPQIFGGSAANDYRLSDVYKNTSENTYQVFDIGMTWEEANEYCQSIGGHLATITSQQEQDYIESILPENKEYYWLGGKRSDNSIEQWIWITKENFNYTNWAEGQPDNGYSNGENYLGITAHNTSYADAFQWNDYTNEGSASSLSDAGFICEWETPNN